VHNIISDELYEYAVKIRRRLHEYPEVGFELPMTAALVKSELEAMGIAYTEKYGVCSVAADIGSKDDTIAFRADMDALPIEEKTGLTYSSKIKGMMHACGHDAHTAMLLAAAKYLKSHEDELACRVRFIFQPNEEGAISGAQMMVDNGVTEGVSHIIAAHCENRLETGVIGVCSGDYMAACIPLTIRFIGRSSHATIPEAGVDSIAMAVEAYAKLKEAVRREAGNRRYIWSCGKINGGTAHNIIADKCELDITFRYYDTGFAERVRIVLDGICAEIAEKFGGKIEYDWFVSTVSVHNDDRITSDIAVTAEKSGLKVEQVQPKMSSEDFGCYLTKVPGMLFRFGTHNEAAGCTGEAHQSTFIIDEAGMKSAVQTFCEYAMNYGKKGE